MVAKRPEDRVQTMDEVVRTLEAMFAEKPAVKTAEIAPPSRRNRNVLIGAAAAGFLFVMLGVWVIVKDKFGNEIGRMQIPDGGKAEVANDGSATPQKASVPASATSGMASTGIPAATSVGASPFDSLRRENIDPYELEIAGGGKSANAPPQLVGIFGDSRLAMGDKILGMAMFPDDKTIATLASTNYQSYLSLWDRDSGRRITRGCFPITGRASRSVATVPSWPVLGSRL